MQRQHNLIYRLFCQSSWRYALIPSWKVSSPFSARLLLFYQAKTLRARTIPPATQAIWTCVGKFNLTFVNACVNTSTTVGNLLERNTTWVSFSTTFLSWQTSVWHVNVSLCGWLCCSHKDNVWAVEPQKKDKKNITSHATCPRLWLGLVVPMQQKSPSCKQYHQLNRLMFVTQK